MIRFFYSICFLALGLGLPLLAKNAGGDNPTPTTSSRGAAKGIPASSPASAAVVAKAKEQDRNSEPVVMTKDVARGANTPAIAAKDDAGAKAQTKIMAHAEAPAHPATHETRTTSTGFVIRNSTLLTTGQTPPPVHGSLPAVTAVYESDHVTDRLDRGIALGGSTSGRESESGNGRLARVTAYWAAEGDYYTERCISATGVRLHDGHCAVDPNIIPYGSVVEIAGVGKFLAVDTGSAVINRTAAREGGKTEAERHAIVVDLFFEDREAGERFEAAAAKYVTISWWTPSSMGIEAKLARSLFAEEDWTKIQGKQL